MVAKYIWRIAFHFDMCFAENTFKSVFLNKRRCENFQLFDRMILRDSWFNLITGPWNTFKILILIILQWYLYWRLIQCTFYKSILSTISYQSFLLYLPTFYTWALSMLTSHLWLSHSWRASELIWINIWIRLTQRYSIRTFVYHRDLQQL